jgi:hypothetical protein
MTDKQYLISLYICSGSLIEQGLTNYAPYQLIKKNKKKKILIASLKFQNQEFHFAINVIKSITFEYSFILIDFG